MISADIYSTELINVINKLNYTQEAVQNYIPSANIVQMKVIDSLRKLLACKTQEEACTAIVNADKYFQQIIEYRPATALEHVKGHDSQIDEKALINFTNAVVNAQKKQQMLSVQELSSKIRDYQDLIMQLNNEKIKNQTDIKALMIKIRSLLELEQKTLKLAASKTKITAKKTKNKFIKTANLIEDMNKNEEQRKKADVFVLFKELAIEQSSYGSGMLI